MALLGGELCVCGGIVWVDLMITCSPLSCERCGVVYRGSFPQAMSKCCAMDVRVEWRPRSESLLFHYTMQVKVFRGTVTWDYSSATDDFDTVSMMGKVTSADGFRRSCLRCGRVLPWNTRLS